MDFPQRFRTQRLLLTRIGRGDLPDFLRMRNNPRVQAVLGDMPNERSAALLETLAEHWEEHGYGWWAARDPHSGHFVGCGGLRGVQLEKRLQAEIAFGFLPEYWGRGYATELTRVAVAQGFVRLALTDIVALALPGNKASRRVLQKAGFGRERDVVHAGRPHLLYRLDMQAWRVAPLKRVGAAAREPALQAV